jgi:HrpA-like RNA helicase
LPHYLAEVFGKHFHSTTFFAIVQIVMTVKQRFGPSDLPNFATITQEDISSAVNQQSAILLKYEKEICAAVRHKDNPVVVIHAATGSGKSKVLPTLLQQTINAPLLCLVTSTVDVVDMFASAKVCASYRMGNRRRGGNEKLRDSKIVFATVGLVLRWYAQHGILFLEKYGGVLFDEIADTEHDPSYALLFEVAMVARRAYKLRVVAASATISNRLNDCFQIIGALFIRCPERQYPVRNYRVSIPSLRDIWDAIIHITKSLVNKGITCLVFLPGKSEIDTVQYGLIQAGIHHSYIFQLHAEMEEEQIERSKKPTLDARCILSTAKGEKAVTIADVDFVIDSGFDRTAADDKEDRDMVTTRSTPGTSVQRAGRAGRVMEGGYLLMDAADCPVVPEVKACPMDAVMQVLALERYHLRVGISACRLCAPTADVVYLASRRLRDLNFTDEQLLIAMVKVPLPLKDSAVLFKAEQYGLMQ